MVNLKTRLGFALLMAMVFSSVCGLLSLQALQTAMLETKMAAFFVSAEKRFHLASDALSEGEQAVETRHFILNKKIWLPDHQSFYEINHVTQIKQCVNHKEIDVEVYRVNGVALASDQVFNTSLESYYAVPAPSFDNLFGNPFGRWSFHFLNRVL